MTPAEEKAEAVLIVIKRLFKWAALSIACLCLALAVCVGGWYVFENRHSILGLELVQSELKGIELGQTLADAEFAYDIKFVGESALGGSEYQLIGGTEDLAISSDTIKSGFSYKITFKEIDGKVVEVNYYCGEYDSSSILNVSCGDYGEKILNKIRNVDIFCSISGIKFDDGDDSKDKQKKFRIYSPQKYNVRFVLRMNKVVGFYIFDGKSARKKDTPSKNWVRCK
jgi:hypothetical protein